MQCARTTQAKEHAEFVRENKTLQLVSSGQFMACILCLEDPKMTLRQCLRKVKPNQITNYNKHANGVHSERISEIKAEKRAKLEEKNKKNSKVSLYAVFMYVLL